MHMSAKRMAVIRRTTKRTSKDVSGPGRRGSSQWVFSVCVVRPPGPARLKILSVGVYEVRCGYDVRSAGEDVR